MIDPHPFDVGLQRVKEWFGALADKLCIPCREFNPASERNDIEREGLEITFVANDPNGLRTYDRAFVVKNKANLCADLDLNLISTKAAWDIAKFLTRNVIRAERLKAVRSVRRLVGLPSSPYDPSD
jgi:hypothetical protein